VGGLAYLMGGNVAGLVSPGHDGKIFLSALLPLVLLLVHWGVRGGRLWAWGALAIATTLAVLTPHPQLLQYLLLVAGAYTVFLAFTADDAGQRLPRDTALARVGLAALAFGVGLLGGAIQFWPVLEYTAWSPRAGGKGWEHAISYSMPPEELINTYLPQFSGILERYTGRNVIHLHSEYLGAAVLVLAALAVGARLARSQRRFWTGVLVVSLLWALGGYTPFYHLVYAVVPGTKFFRAPSTMLYVVQFSVAVLAAFGADRLIAGRARPRAAAVAVAASLVMALLATSGALTNVAASFAAAPQLAPLVDQNAAAVTMGGWRSFLAVAAVAALLAAAARRSLPPVVAGGLLAGVVALDLWSIGRLYWQFSPPAAQLYAADPVIRYLEQHSDSGRVVPIALAELPPLERRDPYLGGGDGRAGGLMAHGVRSVAGYHGNQLGNFLRLSGWSEGDNRGDWPRQVGNPNFWKLLNIRYLYTNVAEPPIEGATLVAGPARNAVGTMTYLYRLPGDNPPAWVTSIAVKAPDDAVLATVLDPRFDVRTAAIFDSAATVATQPVPQQLPAPLDLTVRLTAREPGRLTLALDRPAPAGATLVVSENYYPGWTATVDGRPAPVGRADYTLLGVPLPPAPARSRCASRARATRPAGRSRSPCSACRRSPSSEDSSWGAGAMSDAHTENVRRAVARATPLSVEAIAPDGRALVIIPTYNERATSSASSARCSRRARCSRCSWSTTTRRTAPGTWSTPSPTPTRACTRCTGRGSSGWERPTSPASAGRSSATTRTSSRWMPTSRTTRGICRSSSRRPATPTSCSAHATARGR
jgi:hypothetical protein